MRISDMAFLRDQWHPVLRSADLAQTPVGVKLLGQDWVVWRDENGRAVASPNRCPHRGGSLANGWVTNGQITCPYHGWQFASSGDCVAIPYVDSHLPIPQKARLEVALTDEAYGLIWMSPGAPAGPIPRWDEGESGAFDLRVEFFDMTRACALRVVDNALDLSHITFVHRGTFGVPGELIIPPLPSVEATPNGFVGRFTLPIPGVGPQLGVDAAPDERFERATEIELLSPLVVRTRFYFSQFPDGSRDYCFFGAATPIDDDHCIYVRVTALSEGGLDRPFEEFHAFSLRVREEDRVILEATPADFSLNITDEVHLRADRLTLEYRRYLAALVGARTEAPVGIAV